MTNKLAIGLGIFILAFFAVSYALGLDWHIFLARKFIELVEWTAFWR